MEALRRELAEKAQLVREQANDLQENARTHREMQTNDEARVHKILAAQAERWKTHCDELTQQCDAGMAEYAERVSEMERDMDELTAKYIEASEKLEQWDLWWQEGSTNAREAEVPPQNQLTGARKGSRQLQRRNGDSSQLLQLYSLSLLFRKSFCLRLFRQVRSQKFPGKGE